MDELVPRVEPSSECRLDAQSVISLSDYGSDTAFDDLGDDGTLVVAFNTSQQDLPDANTTALPTRIEWEESEKEEEEEQDVDGFVPVRCPTAPPVADNKSRVPTTLAQHVQSSPVHEREALEVEYDPRSRRAWSVPLEDPTRSSRDASLRYVARSPHATKPPLTPSSPAAKALDTRPPLERFRTQPKKCLSVTDLVSPAWCELQYFYTLSRFGRKPSTQAMRTGSKIHQKLQDEVHTTVPVPVQSKEDRFGLRMWNTIAGLRCLRETGLTRELEVWGILHGQVVNGVIDELSHACPDADFEAQWERSVAEKNGGIVPLPPRQITLPEAFANASPSVECRTCKDGLSSCHRQIYLVDVKTRSVPSLPTGASLRPTHMQLMLYRKLLESLALNTVDAESIFSRYDVQPLSSFSTAFLEAVADLGPGHEAPHYPNLLSLWSLLVTEAQIAVPPTRLSPILRAEFRYATTGEVLGSDLIVYTAQVIDAYVSEEMAWWKGQREAKGVEIEEAFKCRSCSFADECAWRRTKVEEATEKARLRRSNRGKSAV